MECKKILHNNSNIDTRNYVAYYMAKIEVINVNTVIVDKNLWR